MKTALLFVETCSEILPECRFGERQFKRVIRDIKARSVVVRTPTQIGGGVVIGESIITSNFLVGNYGEDSVLLSVGKKMPAFVVQRDPVNNLAKLAPACALGTGNDTDNFSKLAKSLTRKVFPSPPLAIGDTLVVSNCKTGVPHVHLASMEYSTRLGAYFEEKWKIDGNAPRGLLGNAVWDTEGNLKGLALGAMIPPPAELLEGTRMFASDEREAMRKFSNRFHEDVKTYALPASLVLDFVETN